jgi:serine protease inhibitor
MRLSAAWLGMVAPLVLGGCPQQATDPATDGSVAHIDTFLAEGQRKSPDDLLAGAPTDPVPVHQDFAFADFRAHTPFDENTLSAPFDLQQLLAMVALGADGTTLEAFTAASGFDLADSATVAGLSLWEQQVDGLAGVARRRLLWGQHGYRFASDYLQAQAELFGPAMSGLDFQAAFVPATESITATLGDKPYLGDLMGSRTRLVAAQTTRLESGWSADLGVTPVSGRFGAQDAQRRVAMVRLDGWFNVAGGENYRAVEVPLAAAGLSLLMLTPAPGAFDAVRNGLDVTFWNDLRSRLAPAEATVYVPDFVLERDVADDQLPDLGVALTDGAPVIMAAPGTGSSFTINGGDPSQPSVDSTAPTGPADPATAANFTPVNNAGFLYLEVPRQHVSLRVEPQGLSAATVTAAVHTATEYEPQYLFDGSGGGSQYGATLTTGPGSTQPCFYPPDQRPFLFAVYAGESGTLLYLGQVLALDGPLVEPDWTVQRYLQSCGDSPPVEVYRYSGALQCQPDSGISLGQMQQTLTAAGIEVLDAYESGDGRAYIALCGSPDGSINVFTIHASQLAQAEALGFSPLSSLSTTAP